MRRARNEGLLIGEPKVLAAQFVALLTGDFHVPLLLGLKSSPTARELERRSAAAVKAFLYLARPQGPEAANLHRTRKLSLMLTHKSSLRR
jgi:hypothetical protein